MSKQEEAGLILKLYELRREETMRKARDWFFREFNPETVADFNAAMFSPNSGYLRMVISYWAPRRNSRGLQPAIRCADGEADRRDARRTRTPRRPARTHESHARPNRTTASRRPSQIRVVTRASESTSTGSRHSFR
jgi:hypothetical protein